MSKFEGIYRWLSELDSKLARDLISFNDGVPKERVSEYSDELKNIINLVLKSWKEMHGIDEKSIKKEKIRRLVQEIMLEQELDNNLENKKDEKKQS